MHTTRFLTILLFISASSLCSGQALAVTVHTVTTADDVFAADGLLSLREAFESANADGDASEIVLSPVTYTLDLCGAMPAHLSNATGSLVHAAAHQITVFGNGATIVQTCQDQRVMRSSSALAQVVLTDLTLTGGQVTEMAPGDDGVEVGGGGGLLAFGPVILTDVHITGNTAIEPGGGLRALGSVSITGGSITNNSASFGGGGADIGSGFSNVVPHLTMTDGLVTGNDSSGLFLRFGTNVITDSTITGNVGSGIFADHGIFAISGSALSNNGGRGFVAIDGSITVTDVDVIGNATQGITSTGSGSVDVTDSTIADNGTHGVEFTGCNGTEGDDTVIVTGSTITGNGGFGIHHIGCGYSTVTMTEVSGNGGGIRCSTCEGVEVELAEIANNSPMSGIDFRPGWEGDGGALIVRGTLIQANHSETDGGGIRAREAFDDAVTTVTVSESSVVSDNTTTGRGGGIYAEGTTFIGSSVVSGNETAGEVFEPGGDGGGVYVRMGDLLVGFSTIQGNTAQGNGGGLAHDAFSGNQMSLFQTDILDNHADGLGGGVLADFTSLVVVSYCTLSGNSSVAQGGGFAGLDTAGGFHACTISDNTASAVGGGIYYRDSVLPGNPLELSYTTVSGNVGPQGGGIFADIRSPAGVELENTTVSGNTGSGVQTQLTTPITLDSATIVENGPHNVVTAGLLTSTQSVIASAVGGNDCLVGLSTSLGYTFASDGTCGLGLAAGDVSFGGDPGLGPLQDNGGPTETHEPEAGSPLLALVPAAACSQPDDQRFEPRPGGVGCEPGAVEVGIAFLLPGTLTATPALPSVIDVFAALPVGLFLPESLAVVVPPKLGAVTVVGGTLVYAAPLSFVGQDTFTYRLCYASAPTECVDVPVEVKVTDGKAPGCTIVGTKGSDILIGSRRGDVICGLGGNDIIFGRGGGDLILGGPGHDLIFGGPGYDLINGGKGYDLCFLGFGGGESVGCE